VVDVKVLDEKKKHWDSLVYRRNSFSLRASEFFDLYEDYKELYEFAVGLVNESAKSQDLYGIGEEGEGHV
jgi:hypothetical protein